MAARPATRGEKVAARESAILVAAHHAFTDQGYDGARMADIARRASVAEGTLYLYFRNKAALLDAVVAAFYEALTQGAEAGVAELGDTWDRLAFLARHHLDECLREWRLLEQMISRRTGHGGDGADYQTLNRRYVAVFDAVVREGQHRGDFDRALPLRLLRDLFYGTLEYSVRTLNIHGTGRAERDAVVEGLLAIIRRGSAAAEAATAPDRRLAATADRLEALADRLERQASQDRARRRRELE